MINEKANMALCKRIVFSGVRFNIHGYNGDFKNTEIKKFVDNYFSKDIIQSVIKELTPEEQELLNESQAKL